MARISPFLAGPGFGLGLLLAGCGSAPPPAPPPPEVGVITLATEPVELTTELPGRTSPFEVAEIRPQVGGIIQKRLFEEGGHVRRGEQLYQIDPAPYEAALAEAEATLARAHANLGAVTTRARRTAALVKENAVSRQEAEDAAAALGQANADVAAGKAAVQAARINLNYTRLSAPISGRISRSRLTVGALVSPSQAEPLAVVQRLDPIYVDVTQSSNALLQMKRALLDGTYTRSGPNAARVRLLLQDGTEYPLTGELQFSEVTVDPSTGSVVLRARFSNPKEMLLPGMYVRARLVEAIDQQAILVPQNAVSRNPKGTATAFIVGAGNKVELRDLETARAVNNHWVVTKGLKPGDRLIVDGLQRVRPGSVVKPVSASSKAAG